MSTHVPALVFPSFAQTCVRGIRDDEMADPTKQRADTRIRRQARMLGYSELGKVGRGEAHERGIVTLSVS